jgi:hypothetical protein
MTDIVTRLIVGPLATPETEARIRAERPAYADYDYLNFNVFEVTVDAHKVVYCCWAGGLMVGKEPRFTTVGLGALEALATMPLGQNRTLVFQELRLGSIPLRDKVLKCLRGVAPSTKVCFFGDLAGELDGKMSPAFNLSGPALVLTPDGSLEELNPPQPTP